MIQWLNADNNQVITGKSCALRIIKQVFRFTCWYSCELVVSKLAVEITSHQQRRPSTRAYTNTGLRVCLHLLHGKMSAGQQVLQA